MARLVSGPSVTSVISPGRRRASSRMRSTAWRSDSGAAGGGSSAWPRPCGPCVSGVVSSARTSGVSRPSATSTSRPAGELEDGPRVDRDLAGVDVARDAGRGDELGVGRGGGVEQREAVVDAGVDVEDERHPVGHGPMLAERLQHPRDDLVAGQAVDVDDVRADRGQQRLAPRRLVGQERLARRRRRPAGGRRPSRTASARTVGRARAARRRRRPARPSPRGRPGRR